MNPRVAFVESTDDHKPVVRFANHEIGVYDCAPFLKRHPSEHSIKGKSRMAGLVNAPEKFHFSDRDRFKRTCFIHSSAHKPMIAFPV